MLYIFKDSRWVEIMSEKSTQSSSKNNATPQHSTDTGGMGDAGFAGEFAAQSGDIKSMLSSSSGETPPNPKTILQMQSVFGNRATMQLLRNKESESTLQPTRKTDVVYPFAGLRMAQRETVDNPMAETVASIADVDELGDVSENGIIERDALTENESASLDDKRHGDNESPSQFTQPTPNTIIPLIQRDPEGNALAYSGDIETSPLPLGDEISPAQSGDIQRGKKADAAGAVAKSFGEGLFDATIGGGFFAWKGIAEDLKSEPNPQLDDIIYGEGKIGTLFYMIDKTAEITKAMVNTLTSLGVITGFLSLWPLVAPVTAPLAASFGLLATIGHGIAAILKSIMVVRDLYRLHQLKDDWARGSKGYYELKKKAWADGASVLGSVLGFISGAAFGAFDPSAAAGTIMELSGQGAGKAAAGIGASAGTAQAFGTGGDILGGSGDALGQTLYGDKGDDGTITIPADVFAAWEAEIMELAGITSESLEEDDSTVDELQETISNVDSGMGDADSQLDSLSEESIKVSDEVHNAEEQANRVAEVADSGEPLESEPDAEKLESAEEKLIEAEDALDLPSGVDPGLTITVTSPDGVESEPDMSGGGSIPGSKASMPPRPVPSITITDPDGNTTPFEMSREDTFNEDSESATPEFQRKELQGRSISSTGAEPVIQRGIGSKIKKKFGSIKKWMAKKLGNFSKRIKKIVAKVKGKITGWAMKFLGLDKEVKSLKESFAADKEMIPEAQTEGVGAKESIEQAKEKLPEIADALAKRKE